MPIVIDYPDTPSPLGMTGEADWKTLLDYTGEITEEVARSWWADVPVSAWPEVARELARIEGKNPELVRMLRRITGL
jgi:hypothetical protein